MESLFAFGRNIIPQDEDERLVALNNYKIFGTPPEHGFHRLAKLAAEVFKVDSALICLVNENDIYVKAAYGGPEGYSILRETGLSALAVLQTTPTVFQDTMLDKEVFNSPVVQKYGIRFYAGVPLLTEDNKAIGSLCLLDKEPRLFNEEQQEMLQDMAAVVMEQIELRRLSIEHDRKQKVLNRRLFQQEVRFSDLIENAPIGICFLIGPDRTVEVINKSSLKLWGRDS